MYKINGIVGEIKPEELGQTLTHEHITCADWSMRMNFGPAYYEENKLVDLAVAHFKKLKQYGIRTVVDGTPINLGRDIGLLRQVAERSGMNIIASSGFYYMEEPWLAAKTVGQIYDLLDNECVNGIAGTDSRPGIMKAAVSDLGLTDLQDKLLGIVARLAVAHGLPVFCHHDVSIKSGMDIIKRLCREGLPENRIILGHCSDTNDLDYLRRVAETGCYIGMDRLGYCEGEHPFNSLAHCIQNIAALCDMGYQDRILLSHDMTTYSGFEYSWKETITPEYQERLADYTYVSRKILPALRKVGFSEADVDQLMVKNPANFFAGC